MAPMRETIMPARTRMTRDLSLPLMPVTASAPVVERLTCFCIEHSEDRTRSRGPLEQTYLAAATEATRMSQSFTASAYRETAAEALTAWRAASLIAELHQTQADELLT